VLQRLAKAPFDAKQNNPAVVAQWAQLVLRQCGLDELSPLVRALRVQQVVPTQVLRTLSHSEAARVQRVCDALLRVQAAPVHTDTMRRCLTAEEYSSYHSMTQAHVSQVHADHKPTEIEKYAALLKIADWTNTRATAASKRASTQRYGMQALSRSGHLRNQAAAQYERACEYLSEQLSTVPADQQQHILAWLDREFDYTAHGNITIDCVGVARVVGSHSRYCLNRSDRSQQSSDHRHSCQQNALHWAVRALLYEPEVTTPTVASSKLQQLLKSINCDDDD